ncbi:MAG: YybH family protein [Acidimicrobiia bacterium]
MSDGSELDKALAAFSQTFSTGDGDGFLALFTDDAEVLLHEQPKLVGTAAIREMFIELFATIDTSEFEIDYDVVDIHGDRAYVLAAFRETLQPKAEGPAIVIDGRIVCFWQQEPDKEWKVTRVLTGRAGPDCIRP